MPAPAIQALASIQVHGTLCHSSQLQETHLLSLDMGRFEPRPEDSAFWSLLSALFSCLRGSRPTQKWLLSLCSTEEWFVIERTGAHPNVARNRRTQCFYSLLNAPEANSSIRAVQSITCNLSIGDPMTSVFGDLPSFKGYLVTCSYSPSSSIAQGKQP